MSQLPIIKFEISERIRCPECRRVQDAKCQLYFGATFWSYVHLCIQCGYTIMESEWNTVTPFDELMNGDGNNETPKGILING